MCFFTVGVHVRWKPPPLETERLSCACLSLFAVSEMLGLCARLGLPLDPCESGEMTICPSH